MLTNYMITYQSLKTCLPNSHFNNILLKTYLTWISSQTCFNNKNQPLLLLLLFLKGRISCTISAILGVPVFPVHSTTSGVSVFRLVNSNSFSACGKWLVSFLTTGKYVEGVRWWQRNDNKRNDCHLQPVALKIDGCAAVPARSCSLPFPSCWRVTAD